jgi:hypothetical protein
MATNNLEVTCPCCEAALVVDPKSGEVLWHKAKPTATGTRSLEAMVSNLEVQKSEAERMFDRQIASQKDRSRILEERFKEAMQRADKSDKPMPNPLDLD